MFKRILATTLVAMFLSFSGMATDDSFSQAVLNHQARKQGEVLKKTVPRAIVGAGIGGAIGYGVSRMVGASVPMAKGGTAIGAAVGAIGALLWDRKANRNNDAADGQQAGMLRDRTDQGQNDLSLVRTEYESRFAAQQASFNALEAKFAAATTMASASARNSDNIVVNASVGDSRQAPAMIGVENCLPRQFTKTQVYDDYVRVWRWINERAKERPISTLDPQKAPLVRTWGNLKEGGQGWIELKDGDGLTETSPGHWRVQ